MSKSVLSFLKVSIILLFFVTSYIHYSILGNLRAVISSCVTFSNQTFILMVLSTIIENTRLMYVLSIYAQLMGIVFYLIIVPLNGSGTILVDALIHIAMPGYFVAYEYLYNHNKEINVSFLQVLIYPALYLPFVLYISYRRGYMIYPFLNNPIVISFVVVLLYLIYKLKKKLNE